MGSRAYVHPKHLVVHAQQRFKDYPLNPLTRYETYERRLARAEVTPQQHSKIVFG